MEDICPHFLQVYISSPQFVESLTQKPTELVVSYGPARYDTFLRLPLPSYFARNREEEKNKLQTAEEVGGRRRRGERYC